MYYYQREILRLPSDWLIHTSQGCINQSEAESRGLGKSTNQRANRESPSDTMGGNKLGDYLNLYVSLLQV